MQIGWRQVLPAILAVASAAATASPVGYSVNSDAADGDMLHRIDLATGQATAIGKVIGLGDGPAGRKDIEGLAFSPTGTLWGVDEESQKLFPIDIGSGLVISSGDVRIRPLDALSNNDFGMTFTCSGKLYMTSVATESLYHVELDGTMHVIGSKGALNNRISALTAWGEPAQLFGLGNGKFSDGSNDSRSLFRIDAETGTTERIGSIGPEAADYYEAGLSFDDEGNLWALTDRGAEPGQILRIDPATGVAELVATASKHGFESLAVAPPGGCGSPPVYDPEVSSPSIPTFDRLGMLLATLALLATGALALRGRPD